MNTDHHINGESVLHNYEYEQDSDLEDESEGEPDNTGPQRNPVPGKVQSGSAPKLQTPSKLPFLPIFRV